MSGSTVSQWARLRGPLPVDAHLRGQLQAGDLVFREGTEAVSELVRAMDGGGWSHVGLLVGQSDAWSVVHAVPAEQPGRVDGVVRDSLGFFLDRALARQAGFYRVEALPAQRRTAAHFVLGQLGRPFRLLRQEGGTYCTELIRDAYMAAGVDLEAAFTPLALPLLAGDYLLPKSLSESRRVRRLASA